MNNQQQNGQDTQQSPSVTETQILAQILERLDTHEKMLAQASEPDDDEKSIDLVEVFYYILSKLHIIIIGALLGAIALGIYASVTGTPMYSATSKLYIVGQSGSSIMTDLQIGTALTKDYPEVFRTWEVHQMVNDALGLNLPYSELQNMISVRNPTDTHVLYITATCGDAQMAANIANAYASAAKTFITQTMDTDEPTTFSVALVPTIPSVRSVARYSMLGILVGTVLAAALLLLVFMMDNRPRSPADIMAQAGIPTLAVIPINSYNNTNKNAHGKKVTRL